MNTSLRIYILKRAEDKKFVRRKTIDPIIQAEYVFWFMKIYDQQTISSTINSSAKKKKTRVGEEGKDKNSIRKARLSQTFRWKAFYVFLPDEFPS